MGISNYYLRKITITIITIMLIWIRDLYYNNINLSDKILWEYTYMVYNFL